MALHLSPFLFWDPTAAVIVENGRTHSILPSPHPQRPGPKPCGQEGATASAPRTQGVEVNPSASGHPVVSSDRCCHGAAAGCAQTHRLLIVLLHYLKRLTNIILKQVTSKHFNTVWKWIVFHSIEVTVSSLRGLWPRCLKSWILVRKNLNTCFLFIESAYNINKLGLLMGCNTFEKII